MLVNPLFRIHSLLACQVPANLYACAVKATSQHGAMLAPIRLTNAAAQLVLRTQVRRKEKHPLPASAPPPPLRGLIPCLESTVSLYFTVHHAILLVWHLEGTRTVAKHIECP